MPEEIVNSVQSPTNMTQDSRRQENAQALARLGVAIRRCLRCPLHESRKHAVPGEGNPRARILLVGEAPGALEDKQGRPFCGRAGKFLDGLLDRCGLKRSDVFITNSVKCHPPNNRPPRSKELQTCYKHCSGGRSTLLIQT
jgi:uracil-DNA glycosylase